MNDKTIIRRERGRENPYFLMARDIPQNKTLSYEAIGMAAYFLSKPDNWQIIVGDLIRGGAGRDKVYRVLRELRGAGYLHREEKRNERGRFEYGDYVFTELPLPEKPDTEKPNTVKPDTENPPLHSRESTDKETLDNTDEQKEIVPPGTPDPIEGDKDSAGAEGLYPCTPEDIKRLIAAWWDWVPVKPTQRGKVIEAKNHFANKTNREFAQTLIERGVSPADMIRFLADIRNNPESRWAHLQARELTFVYAMECLQDWVKADREDNFYTPDDPRITERKPGVTINLGEISDGDNLLERLKDHPDLIVDIPRPYLDPQPPSDEADHETTSSEDEDDATRLARLGEPL